MTTTDRAEGAASRTRLPSTLLLLALSVSGLSGTTLPAALSGQENPGLEIVRNARPGDTVWTSPRSRFDANFLQRWTLGTGHRDLWALPIQVEVLDLDRFAGGLTPTRRGGGLQTPSVRLQGADGQTYSFRSMDKDAARALDPELRESVAASFAQDFVSALLPTGALILDRLQEAAGVLHPSPMLALMPDDPRLGEFREDFAGVLGWIEVRPDEGPDGEPGFAGADDVKGSEAFLGDLEERPENRADAKAFLKARLIDALTGDWDRHPDQWRWAGFSEDGIVRFEPVPRDRDWALGRIDGLKTYVSEVPWPHYVGFDHEYPSVFRATWSGRVLDRRILPALVWEDWQEVAQDLMNRLPDPVIEEAVLRLPPPHYEVVGEMITAALKHRRDKLREFAWEYYLLQAEAVDIHGTDEEEIAVLERLSGGHLRVTLSLAGSDGRAGTPYFERTFSPDETDEVRVHLQGGDDQAQLRGTDDANIRIIITGGGGDDLLAVARDGRGRRVEFFDDRGDNQFEPGPGTRIDENEFEDPYDWREDTHWAGTRDWGARTIRVPYFLYEGDGGLLFGTSIVRTGYGFRHYPHRDRSSLTLGFGTTTERFHFSAETEFPLHGQALQGHLFATATGANVHRFYGFGNETTSEGGSGPYRAFSRVYQAGASALFRTSPRVSMEWGALYSRTNPDDNPGTVLAETDPYGFQTFNSLSFTGALQWDGRDDPSWPRRGGVLDLSAEFFPTMGDVESTFGKVRSVASAYLTAEGIPLRPTLALRAGGEKVWGDFPYHEGAFLGGSGDLRGFPEERFLGDASLFVGGDLRFHLGTLPAILPGSFGGMVSSETGRVWFEEEDSDRWHGTLGGGLWVSLIDSFTITVSLARSDAGTRFLYGGGGFHF